MSVRHKVGCRRLILLLLLLTAPVGKGIVPDITLGQMPIASLNPSPPLAVTRAYTYTPGDDLLSASSPLITTLNPISTVQATGPVITTYGSDHNGNQIDVTSPYGDSTALSYDHFGRLMRTAWPDVKLWNGGMQAPTAAIYSDSNGSPGALVAASASGRLTANSWNSVALSATLAPSTTYWLVYNANGSASQYDNLAYDSGPAGSGVYATNANQAYGVWPATFGAATSITDLYSLYATSSGGAMSNGVGATLGYTRTGGSQDSYDSYNMDGSKVATGPQGGQVVSVSAYVGAIDPTVANDLFQVAIYADSNGSPGALVAASASGTLVANSWNTVALTATLAPNTTYWLMYNANGSAGQYDNLAYDNGPAGSGAYYAPANQAYGVWPATFGLSAGVGTLYSLYATLAAPSTPTPTPTPSPTGTPSATATPTGTPSAGAGTPGATSLFGYTADDRPLTATLGAGTANVQEQRFYDGDNRLTCLQAQGPPGDAVSTLRQAYAYGYSPLGVTTVISTYAGATAATTCGGSAPAVQALAPDAFGRLAASGGITWTYDGNDNLTSITRDPRLGGTAPLSLTYAYANPDGTLPAGALPNELLALRYGGQPTGALVVAYGYDRSGDTTAITTVNATAGTTTTRALTYDATGRPTGVSSSDGLSVTVGYNARGLRASLAVSDAHPDNGNPANFVERMTYRGDRLGQVAVVEGTASFTETFLYRADGAPLELLYQAQGQGVPNRYYYAVDGRGDVTALVNAQGQVVDAYAYDLWGAPQPGPGGFGALGLVVEGVPQPLRYRGYVYDAWYDGAGLWANGAYTSKDDRPLPWYWLGVRSYDPVLERFLQPDPSALDGARSYAYCHDAPADCADPSGLVSESMGPEPDPGVPLGPGLGAPGGPAEGAGLPVAGAGDSAAASPYDQLAYDPSRALAAPNEPTILDSTSDRMARDRGQLPLPMFEHTDAPVPNVVVYKQEGTQRELIAGRQLRAQYPDAQIYSERDILDSNHDPLVDPVTGEGRRFDFVVAKDGLIQDIVEVTSPNEDKTPQFSKTARILGANPGNAYIRVPGTRTLLPIPQTFTQERLVRVVLP